MEVFNANEMPIRMARARKELGDSNVLALVQGYPWTRLGPAGQIETWPQGDELWEDFTDVRIFGAQGEWHAWRRADGKWGCRTWKPLKTADELPRTFILWGTRRISEQLGWVLIGEANGATVTVPSEIAIGLDETPPRPVVLEAVEIAGMDPETGIAGIIDCALCAVKPATFSGL